MIEKVSEVINDPKSILLFIKFIPNKLFLKTKYKLVMSKGLNLKVS